MTTNFPSTLNSLLNAAQRNALSDQLRNRLIVLCFGAGVDSTAMMVALKAAGLRPHAITFANTGGEKPESLAHIERINAVLLDWGWPQVSVCAKVPLASTGYTDLFGNCLQNETLPSLAFGMKSCSIKWKTAPQDQFLMGVTKGPNRCDPHPVWLQARATGTRIVKLIGYDCGRADMRRSARLSQADEHFDYLYPLQTIGWERQDCVNAIAASLGADMVPIKSACFFCPASKAWELYWLAAEHPELLERALHLERTALTGRHSRFDAVEFGATWEELVSSGDRFPSSKTTVGLGRSFAWNHWAFANGVVDSEFRVHRDRKQVFLDAANALRQPDNALDRRGHAGEVLATRVFELVPVEAF